jgi:hypothetical protein
MGTVAWTVFAVATMIGIFAGCTAAVVIGVRVIERALAKHREKRAS